MMISTATKATRGRAAFTLLELILVMSILGVLATISIMSVNRMFQRQALDRGADSVRAAMGKARVKAIKEGDVFAVFIAKGGNWYDVAAFSQAREQISRAQSSLNEARNQASGNLVQGLLPRGVIFAQGDVADDARGAQLIAESGTDGGGLQQVLFYPDGSSQDARIILQNEIGGLVEVQLRGLTGMTKSVRLKETR